MPCALQRRIAVLDLGASIVHEPPRWVPHLGRDILEGYGEVDYVEVEVVEAPVGKLLLEDRLDLFGVVERVPEFADEEEIFALDEAILNGTGYTLASLDFVAVVCGAVSILSGNKLVSCSVKM